MSDGAPRCPFCANIIKVQPTFWSRLGLKRGRVLCSTCQGQCDARDAEMMGASYFHWAEHFRVKLTKALTEIPILSEPAMFRALGNPHKEATQLINSLDELVRVCLRHQRVPMIEMARGREATLEVVPLPNEGTGTAETVAILGRSSSESGAKEFEQIIACTGESQYVLYTYPATWGAEPRVRRAARGASGSPPIATQPDAVAGLRAMRQPMAAPPQHAKQ
jgi:hypothetical protein